MDYNSKTNEENLNIPEIKLDKNTRKRNDINFILDTQTNNPLKKPNFVKKYKNEMIKEEVIDHNLT